MTGENSLAAEEKAAEELADKAGEAPGKKAARIAQKRRAPQPGRLPAKTVIIGSRGRMGAMLLRNARGAGMVACGLDQPLEAEELGAKLAGAELVFLCVPAAALRDVLRKVAPFLPERAVLADITSVKERPMRQMEELWDGAVVGTHPLFGPKYEAGTDLPVAIVPGSKAAEREIALVENFFISFGCRVFRSDARAHDWAMARIQNMNFITNLAYFALLAGEEELLPFLTPSFMRRREAAAKMLNEDAEMFAGLFEANPHSHEAVRQFRQMLNVAAGGDIELLCRRAQWWWQGEENFLPVGDKKI